MDTPAQALDKELKVALRKFHRMRWTLLAAVIAIVAVAVGVGTVMLVRQNRQLTSDNTQIAANHEQLTDDNERLLSSCDFYQPLTSLPVTIQPTTGRATELSVQVIAAAREAYLGQGCPGRIPPAYPSLARWAAYYHIPVRG